ncbi:putative signal peptidase I [Helianthus annuus]|nr:putative signal peptidase I [Helianthus annuus]
MKDKTCNFSFFFAQLQKDAFIVCTVHEHEDGEVDVLTKGDNNFGDDRLLYAQGQMWLQRHHIMGRAVG